MKKAQESLSTVHKKSSLKFSLYDENSDGFSGSGAITFVPEANRDVFRKKNSSSNACKPESFSKKNKSLLKAQWI